MWTKKNDIETILHYQECDYFMSNTFLLNDIGN